MLSKVAAYGFLRVVLPLFPDAAADFQLLLLVIALGSILYGSVQAFTQTDTRLILGYSSIAQLGFITLGIFALRPEGSQGALLQMVQHGLVVAPLFFIVVLLAERAGGSEDLRDMGGIAFRAPVLTALFLVTTLATLAMPGSANFVGEFLILLGAFKSDAVIAVLAFAGVAMASVYMLRFFIRAMHNRRGPAVDSFELSLRDGLVVAPLVAAVVAFAVYPQAALTASEPSAVAAVRVAQERAGESDGTPTAAAARDAMNAFLLAQAKAPELDWAALAPLVALTTGACVVLMIGLVRSSAVRTQVVPVLTLLTLAVTVGLGVWQWGENATVVEGTLAMDDLTLALSMLFCTGAAAAVLLSWRGIAPAEAGHGEFHALVLASVLGMVLLSGAQNLVVLFIGFELLSIPLYVLCATEMRRETSLESGLKYLIIGSVGSATLVYGLALVYGATGATGFDAIASAVRSEALTGDVLFLTGVALSVAGLAFKASVAPFHQWTPDVYEGAPTPITAFMAVATKAAAFGVLIRLFDVALIGAAGTWAPAFAALAVVTIVVGNVGAIGQSSLKRLLAYSSVAQAGYMLAGLVVSTRLGVQAIVFYLAGYLLMNLAAFAVIVARERELGRGDDISTLTGMGVQRPWLAWPLTVSMLSLAGFPATVGFFGKLYLIEAAVDNAYAWLGVVIVLGSAISLAYYLRVIAAVWSRAPEERTLVPGTPPGGRAVMAGGAPEADAPAPEAGAGPLGQPEVVFVAVVFMLATLFFGIFPEPLFDVARAAGAALGNLV